MPALTPTPFERGLRSPREFIAAPDPARPKRGWVTETECKQRRELVVRCRYRLITCRAVAKRLGLSETTVTRWVQGGAVVPAKYLPALQQILEDS